MRHIVAAALLLSGVAQAQVAGTSDERWEPGRFLVHPDVSLVYTVMSEEGVNAKGLGIAAGITVGAAISEHVMLGVRGLYVETPDPDIDNGVSTFTANGMSVGMWGIGPQVTFLFMDNESYLSLAALGTKSRVSSQFNSVSSDMGIGGQLTLGHEWRLGRLLRLGVQATVFTSHNSYNGVENNTAGLGGGVSATFF